MLLIYLFCFVCLFLNLLFFFQTNSFQVQDLTDKQNVISIARAFPILIGQYVTTAMTAAFNSHLHTRKIFACYRRSCGEAQLFPGRVSQHVSSYNVLQKCFTGNVVFWNQLQRSNASNKTSDHLATNIQRIYPLTQTTQFRKTSNAWRNSTSVSEGRHNFQDVSVLALRESPVTWRKQLVCDIVKNVHLLPNTRKVMS